MFVGNNNSILVLKNILTGEAQVRHRCMSIEEAQSYLCGVDNRIEEYTLSKAMELHMERRKLPQYCDTQNIYSLKMPAIT